MDINTLKNRVNSNLPIYLGIREIRVIDICEILDVIEIEFNNGKKEFIDVNCLKETPEKYKAIPLSLFTPKGEEKC